MTRAPTAARAGAFRVALVCVALTAACGGAMLEGTIDPRSLALVPEVDGEVDEEVEVAAELGAEFVAEVVRRLAVESCAVTPFVATREQRFDPEVEATIADLYGLGRDLCEAGLHRIDAGYDEEGEVAISGGDSGRLVGDGYAFVFDDFRSVSLAGAAPSAETLPACGGVVSVSPDLVVHNIDSQPVIVRVESEEHVFLWARSDGGLACSNQVGASTSPNELLLTTGVGRTAIHVERAGGAAGRVDFSIDPFDSDAGAVSIWHPGTTPTRIPVYVGEYERFAEGDDYTDCTGYVGLTPTARVLVPAEAYGEIRVESYDYDPVLYLEGPGGQILCNDDYDGYDPGVYSSFAAGVWEIYVGTYSPNDAFDATPVLD